MLDEEGVEVGEVRRDPVEAHFGHDQLEAGVPIEHAAIHHLPHRPTGLDVGEEGLSEDVGGELHHQVHFAAVHFPDLAVGAIELLEEEALLEPEPGMHDEGESERLALGPERLPVPVEERRHLRMREKSGDEGAGETRLGDPSKLGDHARHVGARTDCADEQQTVRRGSEGVRCPAVVGARSGVPDLEGPDAVRHVVGEVTDTRITMVDDLRGDALAVHLLETHVKVVHAPVPARDMFLDDLGGTHDHLAERHD